MCKYTKSAWNRRCKHWGNKRWQWQLVSVATVSHAIGAPFALKVVRVHLRLLPCVHKHLRRCSDQLDTCQTNLYHNFLKLFSSACVVLWRLWTTRMYLSISRAWPGIRWNCFSRLRFACREQALFDIWRHLAVVAEVTESFTLGLAASFRAFRRQLCRINPSFCFGAARDSGHCQNDSKVRTSLH